MTHARAALPADLPEGDALYLHPGQLVAAGDGRLVTTILGSCVAVCLYDEVAAVGGANHYLLPQWTTGAAAASPRFGDVAIEELVRAVTAAGARRSRLRAKLFGGACVTGAPRFAHIGAKNAAVARERLADLAIPVVDEDLGRDRGRKLIFHPASGAAWVKLI